MERNSGWSICYRDIYMMDNAIALSHAVLRLSENQTVLAIMISELSQVMSSHAPCASAEALSGYTSLLDKNHLLLMDAICQFSSQNSV